MPFSLINDWLNKEIELGASDAMNGVLATADQNATPHSRVVAIREIGKDNILFFTQRNTRKVLDLSENPKASLTLWLPLQEKEVMIDGNVKALDREEAEHYWENLPRERQLRFSVYAKSCMQPLIPKQLLEKNYEALSKQFEGQAIPVNENYYGFRLFPHTLYFYVIGGKSFSELKKYTLSNGNWQQQDLSP